MDTRVWATLERFDRLTGRKGSFDAADYVATIEPIREIAGRLLAIPRRWRSVTPL